jgi:hypothetical protein
MKKLVFIAYSLLFTLGCGPSQKQEDKMAHKMVDRINTACQLTPEQKTRLIPVIETFIKTRIDNKDKFASDQAALIKADSINKAKYFDTLKKIITPEQLDKLKAFRNQQKMDKKAGNGGGDDNGGQE